VLLEVWGSYTAGDPLMPQRLSQAVAEMPQTARLINWTLDNRKPAAARAGADWEPALRGPQGGADAGWLRQMVESLNGREDYPRYKVIPSGEQTGP
jgi:hypothetical protein